MKKICEKNRIVAKSTFFAYKTENIDCMKKNSIKIIGIQKNYKMRHGTLKLIYYFSKKNK